MVTSNKPANKAENSRTKIVNIFQLRDKYTTERKLLGANENIFQFKQNYNFYQSNDAASKVLFIMYDIRRN